MQALESGDVLAKLDDLEKVVNEFVKYFDLFEIKRVCSHLCLTYHWLKLELPEEANKSLVIKTLCKTVWEVNDVEPLLSLQELLCAGPAGSAASDDNVASYREILEQHKQRQPMRPIECTSCHPGSPVVILTSYPVYHGILGACARSELEPT